MASSPTRSPAGTKKLVPPRRSHRISSNAAIRTENESRLRIDVTNQFQHVSGMRINVMPGPRSSITVAIMLMAVSSDEIENKPMLKNQRVWPSPSPGPAMAPSALNGGYAVQPESGPPPTARNDAISSVKDAAAIQKDARFNRGNAMPGAPSCSGSTRFPNAFSG